MPYPPECKMPDLSHLEKLSNRLVLELMNGEPGITKKFSLYRRIFIRLIEKALIEYEQTREVILDQIAEANRPAKEMERTGRYVDLFGFTNHMENCINAIRRMYILLERIKTEQASPSIPREIRKFVESKDKEISELRNKVEHIDEIIIKDKLGTNEPIMLAITKNSDGVSISQYTIKFFDLASILTRMHEIGMCILNLK